MQASFITEAVVAGDLGYSSLKEEQLKVVTAFLEGRDVFTVLPTGYGKSLCFGCLPLVSVPDSSCAKSLVPRLAFPLHLTD